MSAERDKYDGYNVETEQGNRRSIYPFEFLHEAIRNADSAYFTGEFDRVKVFDTATGFEVYDPAEANADEDFTLGPCGCVDYHMADCPTVTSRYGGDEPDWMDDPYFEDHPPDGFGY